MYALIQNDRITQIGPLPTRWYDGDRWHDWRSDNPATDPADYGWVPVAESPRPEDTDIETHDGSYEVIDGQPVQVWTPRAWTDDEIAERMEARARLDNHDERLAHIEAKLWPADPDPEPDAPIEAPTWGDYGGIWPNGQLLSDGGTTWRNTSGVPLTTPPTGFPGQPSQWAHLFVEVTTADTDTGEPGVPDFVQPSGGHDAYQIGDRVRFDGKVWESIIANNVWSPAAHGGGWKLIV